MLFGLWINVWPGAYFDWVGSAQPNHPILWRGIGLLSIAFGIGFWIAAKSPIRHWALVLMGFIKSNLVIAVSLFALFEKPLPIETLILVVVDDFIWWYPFAVILWTSAQAHAGRPPSAGEPLTIEQAAENYRLSSDETLAEASNKQALVLVFLRHFGCTFTRKILRELENLKAHADEHNARLVLVHMLAPGREQEYIKGRSQVARIADPMCELYRAFGLGKGGFLELFGPKVWIPLIIALFKGCGIGHVAGDGLQLPGAFLFRNGKIISSQRAKTQADLPDLPKLFEGLQVEQKTETLAS